MNTAIRLNKNFIAVLIFSLGLIFSAINFAAAEVNYPISELGNCDSKENCKNFCDLEENRAVCIDYAERAKLFKAEEAERMRDQQAFEEKLHTLGDSPGGCISPRECDAYCRVEANLKECLDFGVKFGRMNQDEANKILEKSQRGGPGGCKSGDECKNYCRKSEHEDECLSFAKSEGDISEDDVLLLKKARQVEKRLRESGPEEEGFNKEKAEEVLQAQGGPGGCKDTEECQKYCMDMSHLEECMQFAISNDLATPQMIEFMKRMINLGASGPGGCKTRQECQSYCDDDEHREECNEYAEKQGLITAEERELMRRQAEILDKSDKGKFTGPNGCTTVQACDEVCTDLSRIEECIDFARQTGKLSPAVIQKMMGQSQEAKEKLMEMERERAKFIEGGDGMSDFVPRSDYGFPEGEEGNFMMGPPQDQAGPGGCQTPEECQSFCQNNPQACGGGEQFGPPSDYPEQPFGEQYQYGPFSPENEQGQPPQSRGPFNLLFGTLLAPIFLIFAQ